ncbi:hypothetical protein SI65_05981 [Aspergillus cristatus]|uniref:Uncharacterized protein n=1 Tax=Aspergillus cristatus TaxID=573508 RepID=A0A1E3BEH6_ASPCR|nr:hypothetical protein SI65_05981 [Aspergillus cristatus]
MAGYSKNATIHNVRRALGQKIEGWHGSAPVSQIYAHRSAGTYPEHYQAHCSSIDTVSDVLGEEEEMYHIEYFQGYEQFWEVSLPRELPAGQKEAILGRPELVAMQEHIEQLLADKASSVDVDFERQEYRKALISIQLSELHCYQAQWVQERRDWRIVSRGKVNLEYLESNPCSRALALIMPELGCIAEMLSSAEPLSFDEKLLFAKHLLTQCHCDYDVTFLPNEAPTDDG